VPVDLTGLPPHLQDLTTTFAAEQHATLHYVYVLDEGTDFAGAAFTEVSQDVVDYHEREIAALLKELVDGARSAGARAEAHVTRGAPTFDAILAQAGALSVDLVVMRTHGRTGIARAINGSVTEEVVRRSAIPVLVLHQA
jgi:nucleotide-binding universal stress UspA family protein